MSKLIVALLVSVVTASAFAQDGATKMSRDELLSFLPGTKVKQITKAGSERHWTNEADGTLFINTNNKLYGNAMGTQTASHAGTWVVNDKGQYCLDVDWTRVHEKWCASILKSQDGAYFLNSADDQHKIEFVK